MIPEEEIYAGLQKIFNEIFRRTDIVITPGLSAKDVPGWDSFRQVSIIMATEACFGVRLDDEDIDGLSCMSDIVRSVAARRA